MSNYVQVSYDLYNMFKKAANNDVECEITYLDKKDEVSLNSKIVDLRTVNCSEFLEVEDGTVIRLDKITEFNGETTAKINHY